MVLHESPVVVRARLPEEGLPEGPRNADSWSTCDGRTFAPGLVRSVSLVACSSSACATGPLCGSTAW
jgi:hypothetical protein